MTSQQANETKKASRQQNKLNFGGYRTGSFGVSEFRNFADLLCDVWRLGVCSAANLQNAEARQALVGAMQLMPPKLHLLDLD
jgi:hypothetical protein